MDSHTRSAQVERLEVVETGRRRRWSEDEKLKIVLVSLQVPRQVSATARRYGLSRSQLIQVQEVLRRDPLSGHLFCFRGHRGDLLKVIWHDGQGACLFAKRLEKGRFIWPSPADGAVTISAAQLGHLLSGIDWRHPQETWRPTSVG